IVSASRATICASISAASTGPLGTRSRYRAAPPVSRRAFVMRRSRRYDLDKTRAKHPDMVLLHGGSPRGAERIAACWADNRKVPQVVYRPDWTRHRNAAPFKRNDQMLDVLPVGVIA